MDKISVHLLGNPYVEKNGIPVHFPYKKAEGFFYYLCVYKKTTRGEIISILWGDNEESAGRKGLRDAIYQIKKLFGKAFLVTKGNTMIEINPEYMPEIDWDDAVGGDHILDFENKGFMSHFLVKNSYEFEEWIMRMQEQYNAMYISAARKMMDKAKQEKNKAALQRYGNILLVSDPYNEELYYEIMEIYAQNGNYNAAVKLYNDLCRVLSKELGIEPAEKVKGLFNQILNLAEKPEDEQASLDSFFYGRSKEIYETSGELSAFFSGAPAKSVCFCGEAGIGKSTLMRRIHTLAEGYPAVVFLAKCYREENYFFLNVWQDVFQEMLQYEENGSLGAVDIEEEKEILNRVFSGSYLLGASEENNRITYQIVERTFVKMVQKICAKQKVIFFIDDIHWMDSVSSQLLNRIILTCGPENTMLLCTMRINYEAAVMEALEPIVMKDWIRTIYLSPFSRAAVMEIIDQFCPDLTAEAGKKNSIYQMTWGSPFFLMEMIRIIREKGYTLEMSQKTINVIKCRFGSFSEKENKILDGMSIFPERVDVDELSFLLSMDRLEVVSSLDRLLEDQIVREVLVGWDLYYLFSHGMFKEYAYERQSLAKKVLFHRKIAEYYEEKYQADKKSKRLPILIYHYERCHNRQKTYEYKVQYLKQFYLFFHENFPLLDTDITIGQTVFEGSADIEEMKKLAAEVAEWEDESEAGRFIKMEMNFIVGRFCIATGDYKTGLSHIANCTRLAVELEDRQYLIDCCKQMVFYGSQVQNLKVMEENVKKGLELLSQETEPEEYGVFIRLKGLVHLYNGDLDAAETLMWQAIEIFEKCGQASRRHSVNISGCYNYLGDVRRKQGDLEQAMAFYKRAIENNTHKIIANGVSQSYSNIGQIYYEWGDLQKARTYMTQAITFFEENCYYWGRERAEAYMAFVEIKAGDYKAAKEHYDKGKPICEKIANPEVMGFFKEIGETLEKMKE